MASCAAGCLVGELAEFINIYLAINHKICIRKLMDMFKQEFYSCCSQCLRTLLSININEEICVHELGRFVDYGSDVVVCVAFTILLAALSTNNLIVDQI